MPSALDADTLRDIVADQVNAILRKRAGLPFTLDYQEMVEKHDAQLQGMMADRSLGRIINGPTWISGASVVDGTITAPKISVTTLEAVQTSTGSLNVTGNITAAAAFPATGARVVISSAGLWGYSGASTTTFKLNTDGSGEIGTGANKVTWTTGGAVTVPAATIGSLTIADVGAGVLGGEYTTGVAGAHLKLSTAGLLAFNSATESAATQTYYLNSATGEMIAVGSFRIYSATTGARVEISNSGGIEGKNSSGTSTFLLNAADGTGRLGKVGSGLTWNSSGDVSVDGSLLVGGTVTSTKLSVSTLSAISADAGTITAGSITASVITAGTFLNGSGGTINLGAADVTVNSTGKLKFGTSGNDYLSNNLLHFEVSTGEEAVAEWKNSTNTYYGYLSGYAGASSTRSALWAYNSGTANHFAGTYATLNSTGNLARVDITTAGQGVSHQAEAQFISTSTLASIDLRTAGSSRLYIDETDITITLPIKYSNITTSGASGALPNPTKYLTIKNGSGTTYYIPVFTAFNAWAA